MADDPVRPAIAVIGLLSGRPVGEGAERALAEATLVVGGTDQLAAVKDLVDPESATATLAGGLAALDELAAHDGPAAVLASGDPGFHGIVRTLGARLPGRALDVHPAPSSVALAFARLGLPWDQATVASCHTGPAARAAAEVARAPIAAVLCGPAAPPDAVGRALVALGAHHATVAVATRLGEPGEVVHRLADVAELAAGSFDHRSVVVLAHPAPSGVAAAGRPGGRPTGDFIHRAGMITKPEVRSVVLGHLELPDRGVLWDVGAGSGSVAIEAALAAPRLRVIAVERDPAAAASIVANAALLGAVVEVVEGAAPEVLAGLPTPDRVFIGGGGLDALDAAIDRAADGARIVATYAAVDRALVARTHLGSLVQVSVDQARDLSDGGVRFVADNPVFVAWGDVVRPVAPAGAGTEHRIAIGVGCSTHATADDVADAVATALDEVAQPTAEKAMAATFATIDRRADHPAIAAAVAGRPLVTFPASLLRAVDVPNPSAVVDAAVGTPSVAEAAALLAAGPGARLLVAKHAGAAGTATAAVAVGTSPGPARAGRVTVVGLGPGAAVHRTPAATQAVRAADAVVGYRTYVELARPLLRPDQLVVVADMGEEADRAEAAVALARAGWDAAVVSSGDPGVFAMASVTLEVAAAHDVAVTVVPGVTSAAASAAAAGAPLAGPHVAMTLSDILIPAEQIEAQLRAAASSGCALALFNPRSKGRPDHLARARDVLAEILPGTTAVVVVTDATGRDETVAVTTLVDLDPEIAGMRSMVLVGTADTEVLAGRVVTRRKHPREAAS